MIKGAILLFSLFLGCCFAQIATENASRWHEHSGAAAAVFENAGHFNRAVDSRAQAVPVCYSCFFENAGILPDKKLIPYFQSVSTSKDPLISGDARFIVWRATGKKDCGALDAYRRVNGAADRRLTANASFGDGQSVFARHVTT